MTRRTDLAELAGEHGPIRCIGCAAQEREAVLPGRAGENFARVTRRSHLTLLARVANSSFDPPATDTTDNLQQ
jgi:hypothetical protein